MQKPSRHIIQFVCIMAVLTAIALQGFTHVVKMKPLEGVVAKEKVVELNFNNYLDGSYQGYLAEHAKRNTGFREFFIRNYNQVCYSIFGIFNNDNIVEGKDGELFTKMYIDDLTGKRIKDKYGSIDSLKAIARENTKLTLRLMDTLKQHGTDFLFIFAPSKTVVYPEYLPEGYRQYCSDSLLIDYYIELFKEYDIPHIDFHNYFKQIKDSFPYPLYAKYGTHWAYSTIPMVSDSILRKLEVVTGKSLPSIQITDINITTDYFGQDRELEGQFNLLFPIAKPAIPNPKFILTDTVGKAKPNLVAIADSYFVAFEKTSFLHAFNTWSYWKYNEDIVSNEPKYNWKKVKYFTDTYQILEDADIVMAVFTSPMLYNYMFDFPETAFNLYSHGQLCEEEKVELMMETIRNNAPWYEAVEKQAKEYGLTVEENLRRNAIYVIRSKKEKEKNNK